MDGGKVTMPDSSDRSSIFGTFNSMVADRMLDGVSGVLSSDKSEADDPKDDLLVLERVSCFGLTNFVMLIFLFFL